MDQYGYELYATPAEKPKGDSVSQSKVYMGIGLHAMGAPQFFSRVGRGRGTGWRDRRYEHPEGPCSFRPTGSKRTRRRNYARSLARTHERLWGKGGILTTTEGIVAALLGLPRESVPGVR